MNILILTNHLNIGGITSYVLTLSQGLKLRGHNVYIASSGGKLLAKFTERGINYIPLPIRTKKEISPKILLSFFKLSRVIKKNKIELIHSNSRTTQVLGCLLNRLSHIPHIYTCHGFFKKRLTRRIFPCWGEKVIAISAQVKDHLIKDFKVAEKNITIIHNGIDIDRFSKEMPQDRQEKKINLGLNEGPVVGIIARLSDVKGHIYLIKAMKEVLSRTAQAQLLIVGEGKMKKTLVNLIDELRIGKSVFFIPAIADTKDVLFIMDVFVMPSLKEGLGLSLMEAMAMGLAVVASNVGGIMTLVQDGINGLLVRPADDHGLALAITDLLQDAKKREDLGKQAQSLIRQNFSQEKMIINTEKVYLECQKEKE